MLLDYQLFTAASLRKRPLYGAIVALRFTLLISSCVCVIAPTIPMISVLIQFAFTLAQVGLLRLHGRQKTLDHEAGWLPVTNVYSELPSALLALRLKARRFQTAHGVDPDPHVSKRRSSASFWSRRPSATGILSAVLPAGVCGGSKSPAGAHEPEAGHV